METLRDLDIVRALDADVALWREDGDDEADTAMPTMRIRFSPFDTWYEINSWFEGRFMERTVKGAFRKTIRESADRVKVLFNHGMDFHVGDKVLGVPSRIWEAKDSATGDVPLLDTSYTRDLLPGIEAGAYGSSFMFRVIKDEWDDEPDKSDYNPDGLPERTIREVRLFEFGPVTFPANPAATAGLRSMTDEYYQRMRDRDPSRVEALAARVRTIRTAETISAAGFSTESVAAAVLKNDDEPPVRHSTESIRLRARARLALSNGAVRNEATH